MTEATLPARAHAHGCPSRPDRIEQFTTSDPHGRVVEIVRCVQCGGQVEHRKEDGDVVDR